MTCTVQPAISDGTFVPTIVQYCTVSHDEQNGDQLSGRNWVETGRSPRSSARTRDSLQQASGFCDTTGQVGNTQHMDRFQPYGKLETQDRERLVNVDPE